MRQRRDQGNGKISHRAIQTEGYEHQEEHDAPNRRVQQRGNRLRVDSEDEPRTRCCHAAYVSIEIFRHVAQEGENNQAETFTIHF